MALTPIPLTTDGTGPAGAIPVSISGLDGGSSTVEWVDVSGKPSTYPPMIGTTVYTAKAGNYQPTWAQVTAKPATVAALPATLGTAGQVLAVNAEGTGLEWIDPA